MSLAAGALRVLGSSTCPTPFEVQAQLDRLPPTGSAERTAVLKSRPSAARRTELLIQVFDERDVLQGERTLPAHDDCGVLAVAVATLLRGLEMDLGEAPPPLPPPAATAVERAQKTAPPSLPRSASFEIGAAVEGSMALDGTGAVAGLVLASVVLRQSRVWPELSLQFESARSLTLGVGAATWQRFWVAPGVQIDLLRSTRLWMSAHAGIPLGAAFASGARYDINRSGASFDLAIASGLRVGLRSPRARAPPFLPWADLWVIGWPIPHVLSVAGESGRATLPQVEFEVGLGLSWTER